MKRLTIAMTTLLALLCAAAYAAAPTAQALLEQAQKNMTPVRDYSVDLRMDVTGQQMVIKGMTLKLYFKKPDKVRIVPKEGFAAVPAGVALGDVLTQLTTNCRPKLVRTVKKNGLDCYLIRLDPTHGGGQPAAMVYLDKAHKLVRAVRMEGPLPATSEWRYARVDEKYDMPRRIDFAVTIPQSAGFAPAGQDHRHPRRFRPNASGFQSPTQTMHAIITFSNYRVNKGIPDSVFTSKNPPRG